jgi:hypothetical protein
VTAVTWILDSDFCKAIDVLEGVWRAKLATLIEEGPLRQSRDWFNSSLDSEGFEKLRDRMSPLAGQRQIPVLRIGYKGRGAAHPGHGDRITGTSGKRGADRPNIGRRL